MRFTVLEDFFGQEVEIGTAGKTFSGILEQIPDTTNEVAIIPNQKYVADRFGKAIVDTNYIKFIRLIKPHLVHDNVPSTEKCSDLDDLMSGDPDYVVYDTEYEVGQ